jgi:putative salt-induced outer membrane protein YdiY
MSPRSWFVPVQLSLAVALCTLNPSPALAQATVAAPPTVTEPAFEYKAPPEKWEDQSVWKANVQGGLLWVSGNADSIGGSIAGNVSYRHKFDEFGLVLRAAYAESGISAVTGGPVTSHSVSAENWLARLRYDRFFDRDNSVYASIAANGDKLAGIAYRIEPQIGYSHKFVADKQQQLRGEIGLDYMYDRYLAGAVPIEDYYYSLRVYGYYENKVTALATFSEGLEYLQAFAGGATGASVDVAKHFLINSVTSFSSTFATNYALKVNYILHFNNDPPPRPPPNTGVFGTYDGTLEIVLAVTIL